MRLLFIIFTRVDAASVCLISRSLYVPLVKFIGFVLFSVSNCHMIRLLFGSYLSEINQYIPFWHYGILLPEHEDTSLSSLLNISLDDLKQILHSCDLIYYQRDTFKLHLNDRETFMLENHIHKYYFDKFSVTRFNSCNPKVYYIGIGSERDYKFTSSS